MNERHVIDDKHVGLSDAGQVFYHCLWSVLPVAATIKGPGAAEGTVPGTATRELNGCTGIYSPHKILVPLPYQITRREMLIQTVEQQGRGTYAFQSDYPRNRLNGPIRDGLEQLRCADLTLPTHDAVDGALGMLQQLVWDKRSAMPANENKTLRQARFRRFGQFHDFWHVGEIV